MKDLFFKLKRIIEILGISLLIGIGLAMFIVAYERGCVSQTLYNSKITRVSRIY